MIISDTEAEERFRTIAKTYIKSYHGIILMYDITNRNSFKGIINWIKIIVDNETESKAKVLVGNNCDNPYRVVTKEEGKKSADDYNICFFEASSKNNINVDEAFIYLVKEMLKNKGVIIEEEEKEKNGRFKNILNKY